MIGRSIAIVATTVVISACTARPIDAVGYGYPDFWGPPGTGTARLSSTPSKEDLATTSAALGKTEIFGTSTVSLTGIWLFPPSPYSGGD
jgi:hypothetical protein